MATRREPIGGSFDEVLATAHDEEERRRRRFKARWIVGHLAFVAIGTWLVISVASSLMGLESTATRAIAVVLSGGLIVGFAVLGLAGICLLAVPIAVGRVVSILSTDDLAAFERRHR